jgi:starch synthase (maltosyl-transferring)
VVIPNGIDVARWESAEPARLDEFGIPEGRAAILFVGRLDRQKGLDALLPALRDVFRALPAHELLIVGEGPERGRLEALARRVGIAERVHFAGWQTNIPEFMAASQLVLLPSRWEGMPNTILEAMASGKAVVATRAEGVVELLGARADEQTAPANDPAALADRLQEIARNQCLINELGQFNQARARGEFSVATMISRYAALYETLVNRV